MLYSYISKGPFSNYGVGGKHGGSKIVGPYLGGQIFLDLSWGGSKYFHAELLAGYSINNFRNIRCYVALFPSHICNFVSIAHH